MAELVFYDCFPADLAKGIHNLESDALKVAFSNSAPIATQTNLSDIGEISAGNGYTAGGLPVTVSYAAQTDGTYKLVISSVTLTATGENVGPLRTAVLYNSTAAGQNVIAAWNRGGSITLEDNDFVTITFDQDLGVFTFGKAA